MIYRRQQVADDFYHLRQKVMISFLNRCLPVLLLLCAACGPGGVPALVPTLMELPTDPPPTATDDATLTRTPAPTWTSTALPSASPTPTLTDLPTLTPTVTPSLTITPTPTFTPSATFTVTPTPTPTEPAQALSGLVALALRATILPATFAPPNQGLPQPVTVAPLVPPTCASLPTSGFLSLYSGDPTLAAQLGCPVGGDYSVVTAAQTFERGMMVYVSGQPGTIYALFNNGAFRRYTDTFVGGVDPETSSETAPMGFLTPVRGFLKIWSTTPDVRGNLGWAITQEAGHESRVLEFERGRMIFLPQRNQTVVLLETAGTDTGAWRALAGGA